MTSLAPTTTEEADEDDEHDEEDDSWACAKGCCRRPVAALGVVSVAAADKGILVVAAVRAGNPSRRPRLRCEGAWTSFDVILREDEANDETEDVAEVDGAGGEGEGEGRWPSCEAVLAAEGAASEKIIG